ncbi:hypothetical protein [Mucilaginibacter paludis]|uniref:Lipoprotein n=1 Tax=Mucilaginibacter paludis DSM 18603 TaxID=714943 RepID=H1YDP0_9SPHI|nr:hypothetical protein [Mucilaginibacter paludis]EHQ30729.1 hypothetical protein Mucpa_6679 [Mucilaginibacter paludis DSM 18603]
MKKLLLVLIWFVCLLGCKKEDFSYQSDFEKSYNAWLSFKSTSGNNYDYTVVSGSVFGFGSTTIITVINGKITARSYEAYRIAQSPGGNTTVLKSWAEDASSLNTHASEGALLLTLDEVYDKAKSVWLKADKKTNDISFVAANNGLISACGYYPNGCQDDCFFGINIASIKAR